MRLLATPDVVQTARPSRPSHALGHVRGGAPGERAVRAQARRHRSPARIFERPRQGWKRRLVPVGEVALARRRRLPRVAPRPGRRAEPRSTLFLSSWGKALSRQGFWKLIIRYARKAGITKPIRPTSSATPSRRTCSSEGPTYAASRPCSATPTSPPPRSTPTWQPTTFEGPTSELIRGLEPE